MDATEYLSVADVIAIHEQAMRKVGAEPRPVRDVGLLETAVTRPRMAAWYEDAGLIRQAALLGAGFSQAQAFFDGNKRTACLAMNTIPRLNGLSYVGGHIALAQQLEQIADPAQDRTAAVDAFEMWLRENVRARTEDT
jgi:death-on-curing protein